MDKGSNISFPLDSGSTVYNGSGISVGGKASTDILHAAGGTTKIKTLNGIYFGDIWTNLDGILIDTPVGASESTPNYVYIINDPDKFTDTLSDAPTNADRVVVVSGHTGGYITKWALGEYADIIPVSVGGSATTYMCDLYWVDYDNTQNTLLVGGRADYGSTAGLAGFLSSSGSGFVVAHVGFRCLTLIS